MVRFVKPHHPSSLPPSLFHIDLRYTINFDALTELGWKEEVSWEDGLRRTVEWYHKFSSSRCKDIEAALAPHPCRLSVANLSDDGERG